MKIGHHPDKPTPATATSGTPAAGANGTPAAAAAAATSAIPAQADPSAKIELSNTASSLLSTSSTPEFDADKVAKISQSIDDGTFKINPGAIADKLISNAQELLHKTKP
jgi:negative regulator of flagellin synthesis FlgM